MAKISIISLLAVCLVRVGSARTPPHSTLEHHPPQQQQQQQQQQQHPSFSAATHGARSSVYPFGLVANVADNCTGATKQKALYLQYSYTPDLRSDPALDVTVRTDWTNISGIRKYGANGVFASHPFSTAQSIGGYFGSQVDGDVTQGGLLFSAWDYEVKPLNPACQGALPNATWCNHRHAWPVWKPGNPSSCRQRICSRGR